MTRGCTCIDCTQGYRPVRLDPMEVLAFEKLVAEHRRRAAEKLNARREIVPMWNEPVVRHSTIIARHGTRLTSFGKTMTLNQWAAETGLHYSTIQHRVNNLHMDGEAALSLPAKRKRARA